MSAERATSLASWPNAGPVAATTIAAAAVRKHDCLVRMAGAVPPVVAARKRLVEKPRGRVANPADEPQMNRANARAPRRTLRSPCPDRCRRAAERARGLARLREKQLPRRSRSWRPCAYGYRP